ncbi:hypothetical protein EON80_12200 [bacterium]|nr:MAG: hypothetical protein EON80_12200 [bacterium]
MPETPPVWRTQDAKLLIETDLKAFINQLNSLSKNSDLGNFKIGPYLALSRVGFFGSSEWANYFTARRSKNHLRLDKVEIEALEGDTAQVAVTTSLLTPDDKPMIEVYGEAEPVYGLTETLHLRREFIPWDKANEKWRILPPAYKEATGKNSFSLNQIAYFAGQRRDTLPQLRAMISLRHMEALGLGAMQMSQDYRDRFTYQNDFWREAIYPYVQSDGFFIIPGTNTPYSFNDNLSDKYAGDIKDYAHTVLFYEGENNKPVFRYDGKAAIAFADGHAALVSPDEADELSWKP